MSIITISSGSYSRGQKVAKSVAQTLNFECISREVLIEASEQFNVPELKLLRAFRDAPSIFDRFTFGKEKYNSYIQTAVLQHFQKDNVVYHGLAGHHFVKGVSHVLKVRVVDTIEERVALVMQRDAVFEQAISAMKGLDSQGLHLPESHKVASREEALQILQETDEARRQWGLYLYGVDTTDPSIYDLVLHINKLSPEDVAKVICFTAELSNFEATTKSQKKMDDLLLASRVKASLIDHYPRISVTANDGSVYAGLEGANSSQIQQIKATVGQLSGVQSVDVHSQPFVTPD